MDLKDKVAVVTGASSGIGRAISLRLGREGVKVALFARGEEKLLAVKKSIEESGGEALTVKTDVSDEDNVKKSVEYTVRKYKKIDIVVNNAGLGIFRHVAEMSFSEWKKQTSVMLDGTFLVSRYCLPHIYRQERGHVLAISSLWGKRFCASCAGYTASKFGVRGFLQSLREEAREHNVKVTNIMPGTVDTPFFDRTDYARGMDLSRVLQPEDIAETAVYALKLPDRAVAEEIVIQAIKPVY